MRSLFSKTLLFFSLLLAEACTYGMREDRWVTPLENPDRRTLTALNLSRIPSSIHLNKIRHSHIEAEKVLYELCFNRGSSAYVQAFLTTEFNPKGGFSGLFCHYSFLNAYQLSERPCIHFIDDTFLPLTEKLETFYPTITSALLDKEAHFIWKDSVGKICVPWWAEKNSIPLPQTLLKICYSHPHSFLSSKEIKDQCAAFMVLHRKLGAKKSLGKISKDVIRAILFPEILKNLWASRGATVAKAIKNTQKPRLAFIWDPLCITLGPVADAEIDQFKKEYGHAYDEDLKRLGYYNR